MQNIISHITNELSLVGQGESHQSIQNITQEDCEEILCLTKTDLYGNVTILGGIATLQRLKTILGKYLE